ncbi:hypothetical protein [Paraburkholderia youngii]|uniref:hypothetical protein n=1 Tax=Paraburkholderia youngii TaxID=2782701 RepID=UPI003D196E19
MKETATNGDAGEQARVRLGASLDADAASLSSDGEHDKFVAFVNEKCFALVRDQFPGLLETLTDPAVQVQSLQLDDVDTAIDSLGRRWRAEGCDDVENDLERIGEVFDALRGEPGIPLPVGAMLLIIAYGPDHGRKQICVPVRTAMTAAAG